MVAHLQLPRVRQSCCGCSLETGSKIVGYVQFLLLSAFFLLTVSEGVYSEYRYAHNSTTYDRTTFKNSFFRDEMMLAESLSSLLTSGGLLYGINKQDTMWMEPFLLLKGAKIVMALIDVAMLLVARTLSYKSIHFFYEILICGIASYMFTVVYSHYRDLVDCRVTPR